MVECLKGALVVMCAAAAAAAAAAPDGLQTGFFALVDNVLKSTERLQLMDGLTLVKTSEAMPRSLTGDFGALLLDRINSFANTHAIQVDLSEGRGKGGKIKKMKGGKKYLIPLILGIKAKMALLSAMIGHTIALIAGKAILVSKVALILGMLLFLKKLVTSPPKSVVHEHIKHRKIVLPIGEEPEVHHEDPGWDRHRTDDDVTEESYAHSMAYRRQRPGR